MIKNFRGYRLVAKPGTFRLPAHMINAAIDSNAIEPTVELRGVLVGVETLIGFEENLLREIERIVGVGDNGTDHAVNPVAVAEVK